MEIHVKICGLRTPEDVAVVAEAGARYAGFVFFPKSPRAVTVAQARSLALAAPVGLAKVALVVDAEEALLDEICATVPLDMLQLHGRETPARVAQIRARYGLPVMKAVGVASAADLPALEAYGAVCDQLLVDAKAPKDSVLPGGNGLAFDWRLVAGRRWPVPWMLAGGLTPQNVAEAVRLTGARQVDVSSGVESAPGEKSPELIRAFLRAAQAAGKASEVPRF
ncbi:phosphoribosylanthranilate isomerase [Salipiger mangrovisoli]|uniref:N-(5'-phosphoribosyl)anthranilate isomerase n=1 Tax=Salipiger mangrovisoli TaxID=2865933 RepID=A0ABR9X6F7_9RHOB|nr:phosphoribosylanthranilate isomerase [Salipiger mangrovisoli]MBE9639128.1 phosphoribosylanthranilate isomerase [Salipiger mangrovisoli]